ncbi:TetR/AcrR family transcriptional regulator [Mucilaginibacter lappiensis]|uniref:AcrR family transcriptional regulator n=1 Tax=Mucilaginibacter lappiensis TaxID=354630 RepID=A0A841JEG9_9SPHI|nr:TetR/AcrR family transcriptional regulator [Mucilaginibacter lappiensis]MBB6129553.1 AcrR family transcriptional regulator [Mucilaginibacter lappiensis]
MIKQRGQVVVDKILDTAERLFFKPGYNITGINQVIEEADIAKASLYKHFKSKTDLLVAYLQRLHERWFDKLEADVNKVVDPKEKLLTLFDHHRERQVQNGYGGCRFIKANDEAGMSDERVLAEIQKAKQHLKDFIAKLVVNSEHQKLLTDKELAELIFMMLDGGIVAASIFKQADDLQSAKAIIQKLL